MDLLDDVLSGGALDRGELLLGLRWSAENGDGLRLQRFGDELQKHLGTWGRRTVDTYVSTIANYV